ncbi:hypothetical protein MBLNU230_g3194t1 [Neophaeotheca triangularis]
MSDQELVRDPTFVNAELQELLDQSGPVPSLGASTDIHALRKTLQERKLALTASNTDASAKTDVGEFDHQVTTRDGKDITVRIYRKASALPGPAMVMLHGGGFILGGLDNEALLCHKWCELGGVSINVEYRLAPESKFPTPVYDSYDAALWTVANCGSIGANLSKGFILAGISAGANLAAVVSHLWRDESKQPALTGLYLSIPSVLSPQAVPEKYKLVYNSREQNKHAPILNEGAMALMGRLYEADPASPLMSPMLFETGHRGLPPTYFQICGMDPLRDEGLIYEQVLREECGVKTKMDLYPGLPHGFWSWWPTADFSRQQLQDSIEGFRWLLGNP